MNTSSDYAIEGLRNISTIKHQLTMLHPDPTAPSFQLALFLHMMPATGRIMEFEEAKKIILDLLEKSIDEIDRCKQWEGSTSSLIKGASQTLGMFLHEYALHDKGKRLPLDQLTDWGFLLTVVNDRIQLGAQLAYPERIIFQSENILLVTSSANPEDQGLVGKPEPLLAAKPEGTSLWNYYGDGFMQNKKPSEQEYEACRAAVAQYNGPALGGACTSPKAERFCRACGLTVVNRVAYIGNPTDAKHRPRPFEKRLTYNSMKSQSNKLQTRADKCRSKKAPRPKAKGFAL